MLWILIIGIVSGIIWCSSVREKRQNQNGEDAPDDPSIDELCKNRPPDEYFRLTIEGDCRDVVR